MSRKKTRHLGASMDRDEEILDWTQRIDKTSNVSLLSSFPALLVLAPQNALSNACVHMFIEKYFSCFFLHGS